VAFHDITAKKQAETALRQAVELQSDFVNFVTHQLRTPLTGIKWMLELVHKEKDVSPSVLELVQDAEAASQRLILLVNELLDIARLEGGRFESGRSPIHLSTLTTSILQDLDPIVVANKHKVVFESAERSLDVVEADPQLLRQALMNLATNAFKYTPPGGNVHISIAKDVAGIRWSIKDSGIGIPKAAQEKLFQKFFRASNATKLETEGTGLGLYMVRLILEKMHATISCTSEEGQGATFEVFFAIENKS
jgi:signal transduction histidine kinase